MSLAIKPASERKCTNVSPLIFFNVFILITVGLVVSCLLISINQSNPDELNNHSDSCGNICGEINSGLNSDCGNVDKSNEPKLLMILEADEDNNENYIKKCVEDCPLGYREELENKCYEYNTTSESANEKVDIEGIDKFIFPLGPILNYIVIVCGIALLCSSMFLILIRYAAHFIIWAINIGCVILSFTFTVKALLEDYTILATAFGLFAITYTLILIWSRRRIALMAKLFKEASKAMIDLPSIIFEPIMTFIALSITVAIFITFVSIISQTNDNDQLCEIAHIFNIITFILFTQFIFGCQNFVISGAISKWYFSRDKSNLEYPIFASIGHLMKFHIGSICMGALLMTIIKIFKIFLNLFKCCKPRASNTYMIPVLCCFSWLVKFIEDILYYLVHRAYVIVAIEGTPLFESGKRTHDLLMKTISEVITINYLGDLVLFFGRILIVVLTGILTYAYMRYCSIFTGSIWLDRPDDNILWIIIVAGTVAFFTAHCFLSVFEMTVDTIFVCFCLDSEENDGIIRPYYMSEGLKDILNKMRAENSTGFSRLEDTGVTDSKLFHMKKNEIMSIL